jgi:P-type Cu2+ transporter
MSADSKNTRNADTDSHSLHFESGEKPTDRRCPCCRVCDLNQEKSDEAIVDEFSDQEHGDHDGHEDGSQGHDHGAHVDHSDHEEMFKKRFFICFVLSLPVLYFSPMLQEWFGYSAVVFTGSELVAPLLGVAVFVYGGIPFIRMGAVEVRNREPGMMLLISLAITVALVYSLAAVVFGIGEPLFWELVTLIVIFLLGHWIEMRSIRRASGALDELAELMPATAEVVSGETTEKVPIEDLEGGDLVLVRPGANVPADGVVEGGRSNVNEAMLTGESKPVTKEPGDEVIGGTTNQDGSLRVRVTATGEETALSGIIRLVEEAQQSRSRTQVLADRAAGWLFYAALGVAAITAVAWSVAVGFGLPVVERVVTVLVIACPHALGLAVPLVVAINTTMAANNGMLIRDRIAMEEARNLDTVVFDKTGTLTKGEQGVVDIETVGDRTVDDVLALMAAAEGDSEHMIAAAIRQEAQERGVTVPPTRAFQALEGRGVRAVVGRRSTDPQERSQTQTTDDRSIYVGGPNLLRYLEITLNDDIKAFTEEAGGRGQGVVYLVRDEDVLGAVALADVVREESVQAIEALQRMGIEVAMLTGDSEAVAGAVSDELGIETYFAEVLPEDKDGKIVELQNTGKLVAMVGDGVNDAPALTRSDVGIAIGSGTDVAVESADIVLVENDPRDVAQLVRLSRKSYRKMQENLIWAAGYNVFALPLAAGLLAPIGILLTPAVGAVLMSASTVIVALNAQLLRRVDIDS